MATNYIVRSGDTLGKIAARHGFKNYREIYDHPANAAFKAKRPNPNLIFPGDVIVIPDKSVVPPIPFNPPIPPGQPPAADPRQEALAQRPIPLLWLVRSIDTLQSFSSLLRQGVPDFLHVHDSTRNALKIHFHMQNPEQSISELDFILNRFRDIRKLLEVEANAQFHAASPEQEQQLKDAMQRKTGQPLLPMAVTDNRFLGHNGILFTSSYLNVSVNCRKLILIHEGMHFVDPQPIGPDVIDIGEADPNYDNENVMPMRKALHNPSSYAAGAWQLANGTDGARHFCS